MSDKICIAIISAVVTMFFTWFTIALFDAAYFKVSVAQTRQNIISFPNGAVFKKITKSSEVLND